MLTIIFDNVVGSLRWFIPSITNNLSSNRLLGVNMELSGENRCNCVIPANTSDVLVGYFRLFNNSNCRLYDEQSGYSGSFISWDDFANDVEAETGLFSIAIEEEL